MWHSAKLCPSLGADCWAIRRCPPPSPSAEASPILRRKRGPCTCPSHQRVARRTQDVCSAQAPVAWRPDLTWNTWLLCGQIVYQEAAWPARKAVISHVSGPASSKRGPIQGSKVNFIFRPVIAPSLGKTYLFLWQNNFHLKINFEVVWS